MSGMPDDRARAIIAKGSKSFAFASALLPVSVRDDAAVLYAYCRGVDDAIDSVPAKEQAAALARLRAQLDDIYAGRPLADDLLAAFQTLVRERGIPRLYADELLHGMAMDVEGTRYRSVAELLRYCYRVAGTVGLMMCHVMGVRRREALLHAAHLGIAMQLTNIARDVLEDWERGRLYLPDELLSRAGANDVHALLGRPLPVAAAPAVARATSELLELSQAYYRSGDIGLVYLAPRCAFGVRAARLVYSRIGDVVRAQHCDPFAGRAVVPAREKLMLAARAGYETLRTWPRAPIWLRPRPPKSLLPLREALAVSEGK